MINVFYKYYKEECIKDKYQFEHNEGLKLLYELLLKKHNFKENYDNFLKLIKTTKYGKPYLEGYENIHFNISHCNGVIAVATSSKPIGIDVERIKEVSSRMMKKILTDQELEVVNNSVDVYKTFFKYWTLKESYLKWNGKGFSLDPKSCEFEFNENNISCSDKLVKCEQKFILDDCILSLVYESEELVKYESY